MSSSDRVLLEEWAYSRSAQAFKTLSAKYAGMVYATCLRVLRNRHDAEDVAQDCFLILATARETPKGHLGPWLHRVATNRALDRIKTERRRRERESRFDKERPAQIQAQWDDISEHVDEAIGELPEKLRVAVVAHFLEDQTYEAIARREGVSASAIAQRTSRGIERVRKSLRERGVPVAAPALTALMSQNLPPAEPTPPSLSTEMAKLAVSGVKGAPRELRDAPATYLAGILPRVKGPAIGALLAAILVAAWGIRSITHNTSEEADPPPEHSGSAEFARAQQPPLSHAGGRTTVAEEGPLPVERTIPSSQGWRLPLSNGVTVELVGVSHYPARDARTWWRPNGSILSDPPADGINIQGMPAWATDDETFQFAVRYSCDEPDGAAVLRPDHFVPHTTSSACLGVAGDGHVIDGLDIVLADFPEELPSADLCVLVGACQTKRQWLSEVLSRVTFKNVSLSPGQETDARVEAAESAEKAFVPPLDEVRFGAQLSFVLNDHRSEEKSLVDFDTGSTFSMPPDISKLVAALARERYGWGWNRLESNELRPLLSWIEASGIDAAIDFAEERGPFIALDMAVAEPINGSIEERCWDSPAFLASLVMRVEARSLSENRARLLKIGTDTRGTWVFRTAEGAAGILRMTRGVGSESETLQITGKTLANLPAAIPDDRKLWLSLLPYERALSSLEDLRLAVQSDRSVTSRTSRLSCQIEIRSSVDRRLALNASMAHTRGLWVASEHQSPAVREQLKNMPAGTYLIAATLKGVRCSNVAEVVVSPNRVSSPRPTLEAVPLPPNPMRSAPYLGLRALGPTPADPHLMTDSIAFPRIVMDGIEHIPTSIAWAGPIAPLEEGRPYAVLLDLGLYTPQIDLKAAGSLLVRVGGYESEAVNPLFEDPLAGRWDEDVRPAQDPCISLHGIVTGPDGERSVNHAVSLTNVSGLVVEGRYNSTGEYEIKDAPPGEYTFHCHPYERGTPELAVHGVVIEDEVVGILDVSMQPVFTFTGRVTTAEGAPCPGVEIHATWDNENCEYSASATTDELGDYVACAPFPTAAYVGIAGTGSQPRPHRNVDAGRTDVDFVLAD